MKKSSFGAFLTTFGTMTALMATLSTATLQAYADNPPTRPPGRPPGTGPSPRPSATPTPTPTPTEVPTTPPSPTAPVVDTGQADGIGHGRQEGNVRGGPDGQRVGMERGIRSGFEKCESQQQTAHYDAGYRTGYEEGRVRAQNEGQDQGERRGIEQAEQAGTAAGRARSEREADATMTPAGRAEGIRQANSSDATARGTADGNALGDQEARAEAQRVEYPRAREAYRAARYAEPVQSQDEFSQRPSGAAPGTRVSILNSKEPIFVLAQVGPGRRHHEAREPNTNPDFRFFKPMRTYPTQQENDAYNTAYRAGYIAGFDDEYDRDFEAAYPRALEQGERRGCMDANSRDYRAWGIRGLEAGRVRGFDENIELVRETARRRAYERYYPQYEQHAYATTIEENKKIFFERARAAAYAQRVDQLYSAAKETARSATYAAKYPVYAAQEQARGQRDEEAAFAAVPVRMVDAQATETIDNGVFEPGEPLRLRINLRNFGAEVAGSNVKVKVEALDQNAAIISQGEATLVRNLRVKSLTSVRDALEFRMNEGVDGRTSSFKVSVSYQGRDGGSTIVKVNTRFQVNVEFAEELQVKDGIETKAKIRLTNVSNKPSDSLKVKFIADGRKLEVKNPDQETGPLGAGESRVLEYAVVAHTSDAMLRIPLAVSAAGAGGRRIGLMDETFQVPVSNDYRVTASSAISALQNPGVTRVVYTVKNTGSRLLYRGLQLTFRFADTDNASNFVVIGPNPQYLWPMLQGETTQFVVPVLVREANAGAVMELELAEDGRTVVINRADFRRRGGAGPLN